MNIVTIDNSSSDDNWITNKTNIEITVACKEMFGNFKIDLLPDESKRVTYNVKANAYPLGNYTYDDLRYELGKGQKWEVHLNQDVLVMVNTDPTPNIIKPEPEQQRDETSEIKCAKCDGFFGWNDAFNQQDTPGSSDYNPPGHGDFRPRAFCPNCGFLVAEWDIDQEEDRNQWKWYRQNEKLNAGKELPQSPLYFWGKPIPPEMRLPITSEQIDLSILSESLNREDFFSAVASGDIATVKKLIWAGADINAHNDKGETTVMLASMGGHTEVVEALIEAGADINDQNVYGMHTPLILAARLGKFDTVKLLVRSGANLSLRNQFGKSALEVANDSGHTDITNFLEGAESLFLKDEPKIKTEDQSDTITTLPTHETEKFIQPIKTGSITNYSDVSWYRRSNINILLIFSGVLTSFVFPGIFIVCILAFTGDIYRNEKNKYGTLMTWGTGAKITVLILALVNIFLYSYSFIF